MSRLSSFLRRLRLSRARYGRSYAALLADFLRLHRKHGYTPREIFRYDLLDAKPLAHKQQTAVSKAALVALQQRLNSPDAAPLVEDKSLFYTHCRERGLPIPRLFAVLTPEGGHTAEGVDLRCADDWIGLLSSLDARDIVIKPSQGVYGRGIRFLSRRGEGWTDTTGRYVTASEIIRELREDSDFDHFVIQERVMPHPELRQLSGTSYLQTARLITGVETDRRAEVLCGEMLLICGSATTSNFASGVTGNAVSDIDVQSGTLVAVLVARKDGVGMDEITHHPVTGEAFDDFTLPFWEETCALCRGAALAFLPLRTVGWDIGITADGPVLIEGNAWWDPHAYAHSMGPFLRYAQGMLERTPHAAGENAIPRSAAPPP